MEIEKHLKKKTEYHKTLEQILELNFETRDYIHNNPLFNGDVNIARYLALYEIYKQTLGLNGHIADCGMWRGSTFMYFCKLAEIFEPHSYTLVHGFDWFEGMDQVKFTTPIWNQVPMLVTTKRNLVRADRIAKIRSCRPTA